MNKKMKKTDFQKSMQEKELRMSLENRDGDFWRARSITVGTCGGGSTEVMMRMNDGHIVWYPMQPVEVVELIHQLAANVGCHLALKPREDFSSWRQWKVLPHMDAGPVFPPWVNDMEPHKEIGAKGSENKPVPAQQLPSPDQQPGLQNDLNALNNTKEKISITQEVTKKKRIKKEN